MKTILPPMTDGKMLKSVPTRHPGKTWGREIPADAQYNNKGIAAMHPEYNDRLMASLEYDISPNVRYTDSAPETNVEKNVIKTNRKP